MDFIALGLDARVARAAAKRFALPTAVQAQAIPKALAGKARTNASSICTQAHTHGCLNTLDDTLTALCSLSLTLCVHTLGRRRPSRHGLRQDAGVPPAVLAPPADQSAAECQSRAAGIGAGAHSRAMPAGEQSLSFLSELLIGRGRTEQRCMFALHCTFINQVRDEAAALATACGGTLRVGQLPGAGAPAAALAAAAASPPDVLVATPARVATALRDGLFRHGSVSRGLQFLGAREVRCRQSLHKK